jgi:hypothetical protein
VEVAAPVVAAAVEVAMIIKAMPGSRANRAGRRCAYKDAGKT